MPSSDSPEPNLGHYVPVLRDGRYERSVMEAFGGFRHFTDDGTLDLMPIIELTAQGDLDNLGPYREAGTPVLVDAPQYLMQARKPNGLTERVETMLDGDGPIEFLNDNIDKVNVPVISGPLEESFNYTKLINRYHRLSDDFDKAAIRIFIPASEFRANQLDELREVKSEISDTDLVLLDYIRSGSLNLSDPGRENLRNAATIFEGNHRTILDAFNVYEGENYNFGPAIARETGVEGFGDFAVDRRFPAEQAPPVGKYDTRNIRHYDYEEREVRKFQGNGFTGSGSASDELEAWSKWNPDHCEFCKEAETTTSEGMGTWKKIRMGHYIESVIEEGV